MNVEQFHNRIRELYLPSENQFTMVDVPDIRYAVIDGRGDPGNEDSAKAVKWLYSVVHLVKPFVKKRMGKNFVEPPIEYLCWADNEIDFIEGNKDKWKWRAIIVFIDWITREQFEEAVAKVEQKLGPPPETLRLENLHEGKSVQIMHVGDYKELAEVCDLLYNKFLPENNLKPNGYYHEIYLNDLRRTAPNKRKIVIRQPVT
ncbi:MAG: hypothetical protein EHM41_19275 [Chloroflexi bacterium]|nr:MAG: hypothetical protein EHM41_19275 [Chloroflexota bacterium]